MQFLEHSVLGLRAARHVLASETSPARVTLFPMVHVAEPGFYDRVMAEALDHDLVLFEGVKSPAVRGLTRAYRWLPMDRLGLALQPPFAPGDGPAELVRADLDPAEFTARWAALPWHIRAGAVVVAPAMGLWLRFTATRESLAHHLATEDLPSRDDAMLADTPLEGPDALIRHARDARLTETLLRLLDSRDGPLRIAVVYGAAHMGAVTRALTPRGFRPVESSWLDAIRFR